MTKFFLKACLLLTAFALVAGCANFRAYYNAYFNGQKAFKQAQRSRDKRFHKNPHDSVYTSAEERKLLERAIEKGSKVLELYGDNPNKYLPRSLFMMGESYLQLEEYPKAITKYNELEQAYPQFEKIETARFHRAKAQFYHAQYPIAKNALLEYIASATIQKHKVEAMELYAKLESENNSGQEGLKVYRELLQQKELTPEFKGRIYLEAAGIAFDLKNWEQALEMSRAKEIGLLSPEQKYLAFKLQSQSLHHMGQVERAMELMRKGLQNTEFTLYYSEIRVALGKWTLETGDVDGAKKLFAVVTEDDAKSAYAAEAYYYLGEYLLDVKVDEKGALAYFDSSVAAGKKHEYAALSLEKAEAIKKLFKLRAEADTSGNSREAFLLSELFLFSLDNVDSALVHLNAVVDNQEKDSLHALKAAYARAFIMDEFVEKEGETGKADSLYEYVIQKFPHTEYAQQAERNLGREVTTKTDENLAHEKFLEAEKLLFGGYDLREKVIPAYEAVVAEYPETQMAAKAQFAKAMLLEQAWEFGDTTAFYLAKLAHNKIRTDYKDTPYFQVSHEKLLSAGIKMGDTVTTELPPEVPLESEEKDDENTEKKKEKAKPKPEEFQEAIDSEEVLEGDNPNY